MEDAERRKYEYYISGYLNLHVEMQRRERELIVPLT
jgi:hypothetical protein